MTRLITLATCLLMGRHRFHNSADTVGNSVSNPEIQMTFVRDEMGQVSGVIFIQEGLELKAKKLL